MINDTRKHLRDLIAEDGIVADVIAGWSGERPPAIDKDMLDYTATLRFGERKMITPFFTGTAHAWPTVEDVLSCLISDANGVDDAESFYSWCDDLGYDRDSITALHTWESVKAQTRALRCFLGARWLDYIGVELE